MRLIFLTSSMMLVAVLSGCGYLFHQRWHDMHVLDRSDYCGTPSEASSVDYFANRNAFAYWIGNRSVTGFDPDMAENGGVIVAEMGQRPTGGYAIDLNPDQTHVADHTLVISMTWHAPSLNAKVSQALTSQCVVFNPPAGDYDRIKLVDQLGDTRGQTSLGPAAQSARR